MDIVVFPSPAGVGEMAVPKIKLLFLDFVKSIFYKGIFSLYLPYISISSDSNPSLLAIIEMFFISVFFAISKSVILNY